MPTPHLTPSRELFQRGIAIDMTQPVAAADAETGDVLRGFVVMKLHRQTCYPIASSKKLCSIDVLRGDPTLAVGVKRQDHSLQ